MARIMDLKISKESYNLILIQFIGLNLIQSKLEGGIKMSKKLIMWKSNEVKDEQANSKFIQLRDLLLSHEWSDEGIYDNGTKTDLDNSIKNIDVQPEDCVLIYMDDVAQLINGEPYVTASDGNYKLSNIDDKFIGTNFERLLIVLRGLRSGCLGHDVAQLIASGKPFNYCYSMASHEELEEDHYDLALHLLPHQDIGCEEVWLAMQDACQEVQNPPYNQGAHCGP